MARILSDDDTTILKDIVDKVRKLRQNNRRWWEQQSTSAPDVFLAKPPAAGIPARVLTVPGHAECEIYRLALEDPTDPASDFIYEALLNPDDTPVTKEVYNIYHVPIYPWAEEYIRIERAKFGKWLAERPYNTFFGIVDIDIAQGSDGTSGSTGTVELVKDPTGWQRTGVHVNTADYFLQLTQSVIEDVKCEIVNVGGTWVWRVATCVATDTAPAAAE